VETCQDCARPALYSTSELQHTYLLPIVFRIRRHRALTTTNRCRNQPHVLRETGVPGWYWSRTRLLSHDTPRRKRHTAYICISAHIHIYSLIANHTAQPRIFGDTIRLPNLTVLTNDARAEVCNEAIYVCVCVCVCVCACAYTCYIYVCIYIISIYIITYIYISYNSNE
jgi:hypothetical protein